MMHSLDHLYILWNTWNLTGEVNQLNRSSGFANVKSTLIYSMCGVVSTKFLLALFGHSPSTSRVIYCHTLFCVCHDLVAYVPSSLSGHR